MPSGPFYRGGSSLKPKLRELKIDRKTGQVLPIRGVSVSSSPEHLERFGGPYRVTNVPGELQIVQVGRDPTHFEIVPVRPMPLDEYEEALGKITLVPVSTDPD
jgi:hypothetical protein